MKKSIKIACLALSLASSQNVFANACDKNIADVKKMKKIADGDLENKKAYEKDMLEIAGEAAKSSNMSLGIMAVSGLALSYGIGAAFVTGLYSGGTGVAPMVGSAIDVAAAVGGEAVGTATAWGILLSAPASLGVGAYSGYKFFTEDDYKSEGLAGKITGSLEELDEISKKVQEDRNNLDTDYSQLLDGLMLGYKDRKLTRSLAEFAQVDREVAEAKKMIIDDKLRTLETVCSVQADRVIDSSRNNTDSATRSVTGSTDKSDSLTK